MQTKTYAYPDADSSYNQSIAYFFHLHNQTSLPITPLQSYMFHKSDSMLPTDLANNL
jgi:hypothetical protein